MQDVRTRAAEEVEMGTTYDTQVKEQKLSPIGKIIEVTVGYDPHASPNATLDEVVWKNGYVPSYLPEEEGYLLELLDQEKNIVFSTRFKLPEKVIEEGHLAGDTSEKVFFEDSEGRSSKVLNLPWSNDAYLIQLRDPIGVVIATRSAKVSTQINNTPHFRSRYGEDVKTDLKNESSFIINFVRPAHAANTGYLDIAFVSSDYKGDYSLFRSQVDKMMKHLLTYEPFKQKTAQIRYHYVLNSQDLGCSYSGRVVVCSNSKVTKIVNNAGVPYDRIIVVINTPRGVGASLGSMSFLAGGEWDTTQTFVHEFGHSLANLEDEYISDYKFKPRNLNCYTGSPPNTAWKGISGVQYFKGCQSSNYYRSSSCSIMKDLDCTYFNNVSKYYINKVINIATAENKVPIPTPSPTPIELPTSTPTPTNTPIPTQRPIPFPTVIPTPTNIFLSPTQAPTPTSFGTRFKLDIFLHGIGKGGDSANQGGLGNMLPIHTKRVVSLEFYENGTDFLLYRIDGTVDFNSLEGNFIGVIDTGSYIPNGSYILKLRSPSYLVKSFSGNVSIINNQVIKLPIVYLVTGDINNSNSIDLLDYNLLIDCYSDFTPAINCTPTMKAAADLSDDGKVDQVDYNLFLRELLVQRGW